MVSKHTPGPWTIEEALSDLIVWAGDKLVAYFPKGNFTGEVNLANATLAVAVHDLLAACQMALDLSEHAEGCRWWKFNISELRTPEGRAKADAECDCHFAACKAAIAKATGT
jgi:hypothetical protein